MTDLSPARISRPAPNPPRPRAIIRALTVVALALVLTMLSATPAASHPTPPDAEPEEVVRDVTFPVVGPVSFSDTWGACRGTRCSRSHKGVDIFGHKLAPLVAAADGVIVSLRRSGLTSAGNKVVIEDGEGWRYYYFHLNNDSPGTDDGANPQGWIIANRFQVGDRVAAGDVIGYLGDSGNAERTSAHVHFEIHQPAVGAVNPTPSVRHAKDTGRVVPVSALASTRSGRAEHEPVISAWYVALLKRQPTGSELFAWADRFDIGLATRDDLIADLTMAPQRTGPAGTALRAYHTVLGRRPTIGELRSAEQQRRSGIDVEGIVSELLSGPEFVDGNGSLSDEKYIEIIYLNARGRPPSERVGDYWLDQLENGRARANMAAYFVESSQLKNATWHDLEVQQAFRAALDRLATDDELDRWVTHLDRGGLIVDIVDAIKD